MKSFAICLALSLLFLTFGGCATLAGHDSGNGQASNSSHTNESEQDEHSEGENKEAQQQQKVAELEHKLEIARIQHELAGMAATRSKLDQARLVAHAQEEVEMARAALDNFNTIEMPSQLGRAELSLQSTRESAMEADEELQQIELMYKDQNLADMTQEFVINRGRRRAKRAAKRIKFQEADLNSLKSYKLPTQQLKLTLALTKAQEALESAQANGDKTELDGQIKLSQASMALSKATQAFEETQTEDNDS